MIKVIKCKMKMVSKKVKVKGDSVYSSIVFRLAGPRIDLAVRYFQSFVPNSGTIKETEDSTCTYAVKKRPALKQKTEVLKFYQKKENEYKKPMILPSVLVAETST